MSKRFKPAVKWFAGEMCKTLGLARNQAKAHWKDCTDECLLEMLKAEVDELEATLLTNETGTVIHEATDVANFAMMIADNAKRKGGADGKEVRRHK
jgi:hypothetical protein